ncbi:MAG: AMP-binding protein [Phycisphaerales bacterium]|nr:AMP-binding protein [Phycisphaerales bacterium]
MFLNTLLGWFVQALLRLRYRIQVCGLDAVAARGTRGILFLPNHPALMDPIIMTATLQHRFAVRPLADQDQIDRFFIRWLAQRVRVIRLPDIRRYGPGAKEEVQQVVSVCTAALQAGDNILLYPAGQIMRSRYEVIGSTSSVEQILRAAPETRVVLVRTTGLWGSSFGMARGAVPDVGHLLRKYAGLLLANFVVGLPRRTVKLTFVEPEDLPREGGRTALNSFLQDFYNAEAPAARHVPYGWWERGGPRELPEPTWNRLSGSLAGLPESTRARVCDYLRELSGVEQFDDDATLAHDLGLDSLAKAELMLWLGREFGFGEGDVDALQTVGDVLLAARGESVVTRPVELRPPPAGWHGAGGNTRATLPAGNTLTAVFLAQARRGPARYVVADQVRGALRYRNLLTGILALRPRLAALPGERIGIMLPAATGAAVTYFAALFAGKTPVMVNWTTGARNVQHALELCGVERILTARALVQRIESQGTDLAALHPRLVYLEDLAAGLSKWEKLAALVKAWCWWGELDRARVPDTAVVLLTSGSESLPKAVPLTHGNILTNLRDLLQVVELYNSDCLLGFLPPFHSFGLSITTILPLVAGARAVYHPSPTEAWALAQLTSLYGATLLCGTPTFLNGIVRASRAEQLATLRLCVTGAEKCPERVYAALAERCPQAVICEGYGISECSPVVSVNRVEDPRHGTIGLPLPSVEWVLVDPDNEQQRVPAGTTGLLLVRGPSIFGGYLGDEVASPFVEFEGRSWYRTGDLVSAAEDGVLTFRGRLKRFVKLGGEMVSLPAIESVLLEQYGRESDEGPTLAVEATPSEEHAEIVLFTTQPLDRAEVNQRIRTAGLSALHNVNRVEWVETIPVLGTGKTDYRALREHLRTQPGQ